MLKKYLSAVEERLAAIIPAEKDPPLCDAMRYSLLAGGKRLRPCMLLAAVEMLGGRWEEAMEYACALEMLHTYSLIHDDLPAMDNDSLRRGRPTNHVVYGEGQAVLAGDGLLNYAYERMLDDAAAHTEAIVQRVQAASEIAQGAGVKYMILDQSLDLASEGKADADETLLGRIHMGKTCGMFRGAMRAAGRFCGVDEGAMQALTDYAEAFGMLFQYVDDLLDVFSTPEELGKSIGKDAEEEKLTAVRVYGIEGARVRAKEFHDEAVRAISHFGSAAEPFIHLVDDMLQRRK